jgi:Transposase IS116/IS110/IS902 family
MALLRQLDFHAEELRLLDTELGQVGLDRPEVLRLMSVPGIDATVALSIVATVGDFTRFRTPEKLVAYLGLNPRVRQSGATPPATGGSPRPAPRTPAACWSKQLGQHPKPQAHCERFTSGCKPGAACKSLRSPPPANSPCCAGI